MLGGRAAVDKNNNRQQNRHHKFQCSFNVLRTAFRYAVLRTKIGECKTIILKHSK